MPDARTGASWRPWAILALVFGILALTRPVDHDESQYVAAAALTARGLLPYRDYAYLQTPLQPFLFSPLATGAWAWVTLRLANALLGAVAVAATWGAARAGGASARMAAVAAGLFAACDILLFAIGTARNDALPAALLATALWLVVKQEADPRGDRAAVIGLLLAGAAAAKVSYAFPAAAYGVLALVDRRRRPGALALGAAPVLAFVAWTAALNPAGFVFGTLVFPSIAPADWFADRPWKLSIAGKAVSLLKFLALGPALLALAAVLRGRPRRAPDAVEWLLIAGLVAALLPTPTWRQYLLPVLPPLFVLLALRWTKRPPARGWRIATVAFVVAGLAPSALALARGDAMIAAWRDAALIRAAFARGEVRGRVATLSPQFAVTAGRLPEPRFATGPFVFRSGAVVAPGEEPRLMVVSRRRLYATFADHPPTAILTGGEGWTAGDPTLDRLLDLWARRHRYRAIEAGRFTLWVPRRSITPR